MDETRGFTIKDLLIRLILIIIFIFLLIWLFPMPDLKPLNNQIFADNLDRMKNAAKSYYTIERLPKDFNTSKKMTLKEMIDQHLILSLMDSNGNYCDENESYVQITKLENEYIIKVQLSCTDKKDYIIEHYGCYDICSDTCKMLETTTTNKTKTTDTTTKNKIITTKNNGKIYEYQFVKNDCSDKFDKYICSEGYYLVENKCIKNGSETVSKDAYKKISNVTNTDTKDAKAIVTNTDKKEDASCKVTTLTSTIDANKSNSITDEVVVKTQKVTANKTYKYDIKGAVGTTKTVKADYIKVQNYDVITATKIAKSYKWSYVSTLTTDKSNLAFTNDSEKLVLVDSWEELTCDTCFTTIKVYKYYRYKKNVTEYTYSCDSFPGYSLYDGNKCRKKTTVTKKCPDGYLESNDECVKKETTYSCSKYGSDYKLDESKKTCTKTLGVTYSCPNGTTKTSDEKYCTKNIYGCPSGTTSTGNGKCSKETYSCPSNTKYKTYTLNGNKCTVKSKVKVCSCPEGTVQTSDKLYCIKTTSKTTYSCSDYEGYKLNGNKCVKTTTNQKVTYSCDSGYILNGTKCVKTVNTSSTKNAETVYKTVCEQKYKWSTKTSINGWTYTGNKRAVN